MASKIKTVFNAAASINKFGTERMFAWVVNPDGSALTAPDDAATLPFASDITFALGTKLEAVKSTAGFSHARENDEEPKIMITWEQSDIETLKTAFVTLRGQYIMFLAQISRSDKTGVVANAAKRDFVIAGPCLLQPEMNLKQEGSQTKVELWIQPNNIAYGGLTTNDAAKLMALPVPPSVTLAASDGAFGASGNTTDFGFASIFTK